MLMPAAPPTQVPRLTLGMTGVFARGKGSTRTNDVQTAEISDDTNFAFGKGTGWKACPTPSYLARR